jgi:hypothetical protein
MEAPKAYAQQSPAKLQNILVMDCRGLEFVEYKPDVSINFDPDRNVYFPCIGEVLKVLQGDWKAVGVESGTKFASIDLTEGDWYEYDEKASEEVSIKDVKWEIRRA